MNKITAIIIIILLGVGLFLIMNRSSKPKVPSQEVVENLQKNQPTLSKNEDEFLRILEQNAISGGPSKDGIPAVEKPQYTSSSEADQWLRSNDVVFGVDYQGFIAAYPLRILVWHEILNETISEEKISITYCPLTGTAIGFKGQITKDLSSSFGVSGKLVNSNLIMYDRLTDSYWSQVLGKAINGPAYGRSLEEFPIVWTTWERWKKKYPETKVLSKETGFARNYDVSGDPYGSYLKDDRGYYTSDRLIFEPINKDSRLKPKTVVVGVRDKQGNAVAILKDFLRDRKTVETRLGDSDILITYNEELDFHEAKVKQTGERINSFDAMWFAWVAFYPDTKLIQ